MRNILVIVSGDPRRSPRPAEAIRLAAGLAQWPRIKVRVYLRDAAILALSEQPDDLMDGELFRDCLPLVVKAKRPVLTQVHSPFIQDLGRPQVEFEEISDGQLAEEIARSHSVIRF